MLQLKRIDPADTSTLCDEFSINIIIHGIIRITQNMSHLQKNAEHLLLTDQDHTVLPFNPSTW
jgi:hypothetical protein